MKRWARTWLGALLLVGLITSNGAAQDDSEKQAAPANTLKALETRIARIVEEEKLVGVTAALVDADGVFWAQGFGLVDKEAGTPATADSIFRVGSISKSITGLIAMRLVEEGRLDLNARLRDIAPEVKFINRWEAESPVRLVHLLEHTTGWDDIHLSEYAHMPENTTIADGLALNPASRTARWRPGRYASYANSGPAVMGHVLEKLTRESFENLAQRSVFRPLGLETATFLQTPSDVARLGKSYKPDGTPMSYTRIWAGPSGSLAISARELGRIVQLYIRRGEVDGTQILSRESIERVEIPTTTLAARAGLPVGYGLGVLTFYLRDTELRGHGGGIDGYVALYAYRTDAPAGFALLSNTASGKLRQIAELLVGYLETLHPKPPPAKAAPQRNLENYEGMYRQFTPRIEMIRPISDLADVISVRAERGSLFMKAALSDKEEEYVPLGGGKFVKVGRPRAHRLFYEGPTGSDELFTGFNSTYRRVAAADVFMRAGFVALVIFVATLALMAMFIWLVGRAFGRFRGGHRWRVWAWPMLSIAALATAFGAIAYAAGTDLIGLASEPSVLTRTIQWGTIMAPVFAALGLLAAITKSDAAAWSRFQAGLTSAVLLVLCGYLAMYGWIGLTVWAYTPAVVGQ